MLYSVLNSKSQSSSYQNSKAKSPNTIIITAELRTYELAQYAPKSYPDEAVVVDTTDVVDMVLITEIVEGLIEQV